jgi:hypothetical protein
MRRDLVTFGFGSAHLTPLIAALADEHTYLGRAAAWNLLTMIGSWCSCDTIAPVPIDPTALNGH